MENTDKIREHFINPQNTGEIPDVNGAGNICSEKCSNTVKV